MYANSEDFQVLAITTMVSSFVAEWNDQKYEITSQKGGYIKVFFLRFNRDTGCAELCYAGGRFACQSYVTV